MYVHRYKYKYVIWVYSISFHAVKLTALVPNWDENLGMWFTLLTHSQNDFVILALNFFTRLLQTREGEEDDSDSERSGEEAHCDLDEKDRNLLQAHLLALLTKEELSGEIK
jgi:hypothetical protein